MNSSSSDYDGCTIPPLIYDIGFGWDPLPEVNRLLFVVRQAGVHVGSALELGCGTGRLLPALRASVPEVAALDLSPAVVALAAARCPEAECCVADMSDFSLGRTFDLIYTSANTIRHICTYDAIARMWSRIADHLEPGGVFAADLELGAAAEADKMARPAHWTIVRDELEVRVTWEVIEPPLQGRCCSTIRWTFESHGGEPRGTWSETFPLRVYDAEEFVRLATADGRLSLLSINELRDPFLIESPADKAIGRMLVAFRLA